MIFPVLDIVSATIFVAGETFLLILMLSDRFRHPSRRLRSIETVVDAFVIASLLYLVGLRFLPYAWICMKGAL